MIRERRIKPRLFYEKSFFGEGWTAATWDNRKGQWSSDPVPGAEGIREDEVEKAYAAAVRAWGDLFREAEIEQHEWRS